MEKDDGGLDSWALIPKAWAFQSMWIAKHVNRALNPILTNTLDAIVRLYGDKAGTDIPLWESRVDHSNNILEEVGSPLLASFQRAWATVIRRDPDLQQGDWVIYSDAEIPGKRQADQAYIGAAAIISPSSNEGKEVPADWYSATTMEQPLQLDNPPNGEVWHLLKKCCHRIEEAPTSFDTCNIAMTDPHDLYVKTLKRGKVTAHRLDKVILTEPEPAPINGFTPDYLELDANSILYRAQLYRFAELRRKPIKWEETFRVKVNPLIKQSTAGMTHSKVKGFMWLFYTHALPVATRMWGNDTTHNCKICGQRETIAHMSVECLTARTTWKLVTKEWFARTAQPGWYTNPSLVNMFFNLEKSKDMGTEWRALRDTTLHNIWKNRCEVHYRNEQSLPPAVIANRAWLDFETACRSRLQALQKELKWWLLRDEAELVSPDNLARATGRIETESIRLSALLPAWAQQHCYKAAATSLSTTWMREYEESRTGEERTPHLPTVFTASVNHRWRLSTCPRSEGHGTSDAAEVQNVRDPDARNSSDGSGE